MRVTRFMASVLVMLVVGVLANVLGNLLTARPSVSDPEPPLQNAVDGIPRVGLCPTSQTEAALLFGGIPSQWRPLSSNAWKYGPAPGNPIDSLRIPDGMKGDWWDNFRKHSSVGPARGGFATEATIWCGSRA